MDLGKTKWVFRGFCVHDQSVTQRPSCWSTKTRVVSLAFQKKIIPMAINGSGIHDTAFQRLIRGDP